MKEKKDSGSPRSPSLPNTNMLHSSHKHSSAAFSNESLYRMQPIDPLFWNHFCFSHLCPQRVGACFLPALHLPLTSLLCNLSIKLTHSASLLWSTLCNVPVTFSEAQKLTIFFNNKKIQDINIMFFSFRLKTKPKVRQKLKKAETWGLKMEENVPEKFYWRSVVLLHKNFGQRQRKSPHSLSKSLFY